MGGSDALSGLLSSFTGGKGDTGGLDPAMLMKMGKAISSLNGNPDDRCTLLAALRPYLRRERQERIDEAIRILQLLRIAELFRGDLI